MSGRLEWGNINSSCPLNKGAYQGSFLEEDTFEWALQNQSHFSKQRLGRGWLHRTHDQKDAKW